MNKYSREDILRIVREEDVEFICLQFTDLFGIMKSVTITAGRWKKPWTTDACLTVLLLRAM